MAVKEKKDRGGAAAAAAPAKRGGRQPMRLSSRKTLIGLSFIAPNFIGFLILILVPVLFTFWLSVNEWDGFHSMSFVGLENFKYIFTNSKFQGAMTHTIIYTVFTVVITMAISLGLAVLINQKLRCIGLFRTALFFPYVASIVAVAAVWQMLYQKDMGLINEVLKMFGVVDVPGWFASTKWALPAVIIVSIWKNMGYYMIIYLAALQDVPTSLVEAGMIDGANSWQRFWRIKWPLLNNATFFVVMMLTINSFKSFDIIYALTEGGPGQATTLVSQFIYEQGIKYDHYGYASAAALVLFAVVAVITGVQFMLEKKMSTD